MSEGRLDDKDQIYAALLRAVQARAPCGRLAGELAWCGLWPALDRIYRRRLRHLGEDPDELTQGIWLAFNELLHRIDLAHGRRIAATLVRSTNRDVGKAGLRPITERASAPAAAVTEATVMVAEQARTAPDDLAAPISAAGDVVALRSQLVPLLGADADLVIAVLALEMDQREAAARMGLTYAAARKRVQRAVLRIRTRLLPAGSAERRSQSPDPLVNSSVPETDDDLD
jgi:RNA polymerase sigma-70 factor (ECF subfamily)